MAFCCGLLLCPSVMAFWFGGLLMEGSLLVESGLLLWPSGKVFWCGAFWFGGLLVESGLLLWPSGKAFWCAFWCGAFCYSLLPPPKTIQEGHLKSEGHQTRNPPPRADTPWEWTPPGSRHPPEQTPPRSRHRSRPPEQTPPGADTPHVQNHRHE